MLPDTPPKLLDNDPDALTQECVSMYEALTGKTLQPAQAERMLLNVIAYRESVVRSQIETTAWSMLIRFASGQMLDELGKWTHTERLIDEDDAAYQQRLLIAPAAYSAAGSKDSYRYHALSASSDVVDVAVEGNSKAQVYIYVLGKDGPADSELLTKVNVACTPKKVRPLTDQVIVAAPIFEDYKIEATITPRAYVDTDTLRTEHSDVTAPYVNTLILAGVPRADIIAVLKTDNTFNVDLIKPAHDVAVPAGKVARCTGVTLNYNEVGHG